MNLAVVRGVLTSPPELRVLPSGKAVSVLQITTRSDMGAIVVPVAVWDPPDWLTVCDTGDELLVVGAVKRRFYRAGATTASRVEVEAQLVTRTSNTRRVDRAMRLIAEALEVGG